MMNKFFEKIYARFAFGLFIIFLLFSYFSSYFLLNFLEEHQQHITQKMHSGLAKHVLKEYLLFDENGQHANSLHNYQSEGFPAWNILFPGHNLLGVLSDGQSFPETVVVSVLPPTPPRRSTTAPPSPNPAYQFQPIQLSAQRVKEVYALKLNQAPEEMRAAIRAKRMLSLMQSVLEHDGDATAEYARLKYLMEGLEDEYPDDPEKQAQRFLDYVDATTGKRQQHEANAPVRDRTFAKRLRSVTSFIQDNLKVPEEEEQIMETLLHTSLDKIKQSLYLMPVLSRGHNNAKFCHKHESP